ncbi:portal protein [Rhizobium sp. PRIMUS64]|uniref:portal protein n=1 Tax=Rhizobium sp. PRIMUS64 TaxID=2908925 RepID=UPI001FF68C74|nr:portal protein [Rhizobium sp. PRIMUS64]MCJ9696900.1 portal protein [Rhizobium sp. PRIMUS64]
MADIDVVAHKRQSERLWTLRTPWNAIYQEAYDFAVPMRRPGGQGKPKNADRLFDMTAPMSAMYFAGSLQRDLFPAGQPTFVLETGPIAAMLLGADRTKAFDRELGQISSLIHPFFLAGDWDTAVHEACIDLAVGTACILPVKGTRENPVMFCCIPFDQVAIGVDAYGRVIRVSWKQMLEHEQLIAAFPQGKFPDGIKEKAKSSPGTEIELVQDFWADPVGGGWHFGAYCQQSTEFIVHERYRTQPIAVPRYYRVPGEAYGRGVVLTALPTIKTLNKAQELSLKSAAIQMLGIWGYRAGGTFNPNTVRLSPGEFWGMQSTGGMLGPDVQRLDPANGRLDIGKMVTGDLQTQIKQAMFDNRLPEYSGTPRSASEMAGRLQQKANVHIGAFGRLVNEVMPVIVPRVAEILADFGILPQQINIDDLMVAVKVRSPMAAALNADRLAAIANYHDIVLAFAGPDAKDLYLSQERTLDQVAKGLQIDPDLIPSADEKKKVLNDMQVRQQQQLAMMFAAKAAEKAPEVIGNAANAQMKQAA